MTQIQEMKKTNIVFCGDKEITLSDEQVRNRDFVCNWASTKDSKQCIKMGGPAGTGKTVAIKAIVDSLQDLGIVVGIAAFTGKAVSVLRRKGLYSAQTLHSMLYNFNEETQEFVRRATIPYKVVVVDEGSTVDSELNADLLSFGCKVLYVGDPFQLEPVGENPNLMRDPDLRLVNIHRQALKSPIISFATILREEREFEYGHIGDELAIIPHHDFWEYVNKVDQVVCGFNATRHLINTRIRSARKLGGVLDLGDKIICLKNNVQRGVFNGLMGTVTSITEVTSRYIYADVEDELNVKHVGVKMMLDQFGSNNRDFSGSRDKTLTYWDYGYGITCHKAQGSEWDSVLVLQEIHSNWEPSRWAYTAVTRAAKKLVYAC